MNEPTVTVSEILHRIRDRLELLGGKTRSNNLSREEQSAAGHASRELSKLAKWIENGGKNKKGEES